ncbi:MAG: hypothetical protein V3R90_16695, partial [Limibaculum sp.]
MADSTIEEFIARLNKHLPPWGEHPITEKWAYNLNRSPDNDDTMGRYIMAVFTEPTGYMDAWSHKKERDRLDEILKTVRKLVQLYKSLPESVMTKMEDVSGESAERIYREVLGLHPILEDYMRPYPDLSEIFHMLGNDEFLQECANAGYAEIKGGNRLGRRDWQAVCVVDSCRDIWHRRTGSEAPINVNPISPFGRFVEDVFIGIGLTDTDPRSALLSWKAVHSKRKNT